MIETDQLCPLLGPYLGRQRWFGGEEPAVEDCEISSLTVLQEPWPALVQVLVDVAGGRYQLLLGVREPGDREQFLDGKVGAVLGEVPTSAGPGFVYDATVDPELAMGLLHHVGPELAAERARPLLVDQSNTSIVYDERMILKVFRRIEDGPNPDVEMTSALVEQGFDHVAATLAEWRSGDVHLAVVSEFLVGGVDGVQLAHTSLRDLFDTRLAPDESGGDFGPEAARLGEITGRMHLALAASFGTEPGDGNAWVDAMLRQLGRVDVPHPERIRAVYEQLRGTDVGPAIRVHGDFHLGQVMRTDAGWYVLDFEGEPARPLVERRARSSALRDVAGMLRSFHYGTEIALREHGGEDDEELRAVARAWEEHNRNRFLGGYLDVDGIDAVLPEVHNRAVVLDAFVLDKALYEVTYEASHRPAWVGIPLSAVQRILEETPT